MDSILPFGEFRGFGELLDGGMIGVGSSPVTGVFLGGENGELIRAPVKLGKKGGGGVAEARSAMALKSHSEAERRRRERINGHLTTLRRMTPCTDKLDKAGLLAEVINYIKTLKSNAVEINKLCAIPADTDELNVEVDDSDCTSNSSNSFSIKVSFCCEDRPDLFSDLKHALESLQLKTINAEISSLGGRVKFVFLMAGEGINGDLERHLFVTTVHQTLKSVLEKTCFSDFLPNTVFPSKRRRISLFESSSSSSSS